MFFPLTTHFRPIQPNLVLPNLNLHHFAILDRSNCVRSLCIISKTLMAKITCRGLDNLEPNNIPKSLLTSCDKLEQFCQLLILALNLVSLLERASWLHIVSPFLSIVQACVCRVLARARLTPSLECLLGCVEILFKTSWKP
jgi:hypothetical protein